MDLRQRLQQQQKFLQSLYDATDGERLWQDGLAIGRKLGWSDKQSSQVIDSLQGVGCLEGSRTGPSSLQVALTHQGIRCIEQPGFLGRLTTSGGGYNVTFGNVDGPVVLQTGGGSSANVANATTTTKSTAAEPGPKLQRWTAWKSIAVGLPVIAAAVAILVFVTGKQNLPAFLRDYKPAAVSAIPEATTIREGPPDSVLLRGKHGCAKEPVTDGNDVLVPDLLIREIPSFDPGKPVYAAHDYNGWFSRGSPWDSQDRKKETQMTKEGECWRARLVKDARFHPVQLSPEGAPDWAKIERLYPLDSCFVDNSGTGPCLKVPGRCPTPGN